MSTEEYHEEEEEPFGVRGVGARDGMRGGIAPSYLCWQAAVEGTQEFL